MNTVSPGPVATDLWLGEGGIAATVAAADGTAPDTVAQEFAAQAVTRRFTRPEEVADLVLLLASGRSGNVTGSDFVIDGGLITTLCREFPGPVRIPSRDPRRGMSIENSEAQPRKNALL